MSTAQPAPHGATGRPKRYKKVIRNAEISRGAVKRMVRRAQGTRMARGVVDVIRLAYKQILQDIIRKSAVCADHARVCTITPGHVCYVSRLSTGRQLYDCPPLSARVRPRRAAEPKPKSKSKPKPKPVAAPAERPPTPPVPAPPASQEAAEEESQNEPAPEPEPESAAAAPAQNAVSVLRNLPEQDD